MRRFSQRNMGGAAMLCTASFLLFASAAALAGSIIDYRRMVAERFFDDLPPDSDSGELWENNSDSYAKSEKAAGRSFAGAQTQGSETESSIPETEETGL